LLTAQLYEVSAHNPALLAATSATLAVVALLACLIPARWFRRLAETIFP
jgi:hypothetical protein